MNGSMNGNMNGSMNGSMKGSLNGSMNGTVRVGGSSIPDLGDLGTLAPPPSQGQGQGKGASGGVPMAGGGDAFAQLQGGMGGITS